VLHQRIEVEETAGMGARRSTGASAMVRHGRRDPLCGSVHVEASEQKKLYNKDAETREKQSSRTKRWPE